MGVRVVLHCPAGVLHADYSGRRRGERASPGAAAYPELHPVAGHHHLYRHPVCLFHQDCPGMGLAQGRRGLDGDGLCDGGDGGPTDAVCAQAALLRLVLPQLHVDCHSAAHPLLDRLYLSHPPLQLYRKPLLPDDCRCADDALRVDAALEALPPFPADGPHLRRCHHPVYLYSGHLCQEHRTELPAKAPAADNQPTEADRPEDRQVRGNT